MDCYRYELVHVTADPLMFNLDATVILAMEGVNRFSYDPFLLNLARRTYVQHNTGYRQCQKPLSIVATQHDLVHANYTLFQKICALEHVLVLEDDAVVYTKDNEPFEYINTFIASNMYELFTLGSFGTFTKRSDSLYNVDIICGSQAIIYSQGSREKLISLFESNSFRGHIDEDYLTQLNMVACPNPLIVQLWTESENSTQWGWQPLGRFPISALSLDSSIDNWSAVYSLNKFLGKVFTGAVLVIVVILIIVAHKIGE